MTVDSDRLAERLTATWGSQGEVGFLLTDPADPAIQVRSVADSVSGVSFRFRWLPHREVRGDVAELERRGILAPERDDTLLFCDPRDPSGRHCFLCVENIAICHPLEELVPIRLGGRDHVAGANFAWISSNHYTVMPTEHHDQSYSRLVLEAMVDLHAQTDGTYRVLYNGVDAGATIPWHLHYQITTDRLPVEDLAAGAEATWPTALVRAGSVDDAHRHVDSWLSADPEHHRVNLLVAGGRQQPAIHVFARDARKTHAAEKGLIGGYEVCGDLVYSEPGSRAVFEQATAELARRVIGAVRPDGDPA